MQFPFPITTILGYILMLKIHTKCCDIRDFKKKKKHKRIKYFVVDGRTNIKKPFSKRSFALRSPPQ